MEEINTYPNTIKLQPKQEKMHLATAQITQLFTDTVQRTFTPVTTCGYSGKAQNKPWYGNQCAKARTKYTKARKRYHSLNHESKQYKKIMNKYINKYKRSQLS